MSFLRKLFGKSAPEMVPISAQEKQAAIEQATRMVDVINESMEIAAKSKSEKTRQARVKTARDTIKLLQDLAAIYPFLKLPNLEQVEIDLIRIEIFGGSRK